MNAPKVLLTCKWPSDVEAYLKARYDVTFSVSDTPMTEDALRAAAREYDVLFPTVLDKLGAGTFDQPDCKVRLVCNFGVGIEHIDLAACKRRNIIVTNTPDVLTEATAELAILLMLMVARRGGEGERELRAGQWTGWRPTHMLGSQMSGKTLGVVGFGRIAQATALKASAGFGMKVLYYARRRADAAAEAKCQAKYCADLDDLLTEADFVSLHCPGGAETANMIDGSRLAKMKASAFLINTARGSVVDERALIAALTNGTIAGAGLDVFRNEPIVAPELKTLQNVVLLPHLGSATTETRSAMGMRAVANFEQWLSGKEPSDRVA